MTPIPADLTAALDSLSPLQLAWLSGYCWARADGGALPTVAATDATSAASAEPAPPPLAVTVLSASQTGHAREVADKLHAALAEQGINAKRISAADYKPKTIADEQVLLLVTSTQGEGEPPEEALSLHRLLFGKKAPPLPALRFAVCGLGDSSYPDFCQAGKDFDTRLAELGGEDSRPRAAPCRTATRRPAHANRCRPCHARGIRPRPPVYRAAVGAAENHRTAFHERRAPYRA